MTLTLRIRRYATSTVADVWVIRDAGKVESCLMHGVVLSDVAEEIAAALGIAVERQGSPFGVETQADLLEKLE